MGVDIRKCLISYVSQSVTFSSYISIEDEHLYLKTVATTRLETHIELSDIMNTSNRIKSRNNFGETSKTLFSIKYLQYPLAAFEHGTMFTNDAVFCFLTRTTL